MVGCQLIDEGILNNQAIIIFVGAARTRFLLSLGDFPGPKQPEPPIVVERFMRIVLINKGNRTHDHSSQLTLTVIPAASATALRWLSFSGDSGRLSLNTYGKSRLSYFDAPSGLKFSNS